MTSITEIYQKYLMATSVSINSRTVLSGALFFGIRGPYFDGNAFAQEALDKGANYVVIDNVAYAKDSAKCILVANSSETLQQLAAYHRAQYGMQFSLIAITGSYGKTTTKELIYSILRNSYKTVATQGNLNTALGVALTLLSMNHETEIAIVEMGATQLGDIALCCHMAQPTHGLITAIGEAHLDTFRNIAGVRQGKGELYDYLYERKNQGVIFLNTLDPLLCKLGKRFTHPITYPQPEDFMPIELIAQDPYIHYQSAEGAEVTTQLLGKSHIYNIAAALCVAKYFGIPMGTAHQSIQAYRPSNRRMEIVIKGTNQLIIDSYNASPASVQLALDGLLQLKVDYRVVILGDMAELGSRSHEWHNQILKQLCLSVYDLVLLCGPLFMAAAGNHRACTTIHCFAHKEALAAYLRTQHFQYSGILFKGGNGLQMDTLAEAIT